MNKKIKMILLLLIVSSALFAEVNFGMKIRGGLPMYTGSDYIDGEFEQDFSYAFGGGGFFEYEIIEHFGIELDISYQQDMIMKKNDSLMSRDTWNSIYIPLFFKGKLPFDGLELYGMAGPSMRIILGDIEIDPVSGVTENLTPDRSAIFGYAIEAGIALDVLPFDRSFFIGVHYNSHFTDPFDENNFNINNINLSLGFASSVMKEKAAMEEYNEMIAK